MKKMLCLLLALFLMLPIAADAAIIGAVYATDISAYIDGMLVPSYNIDGYTAVVVRELEKFGFTVEWNEQTRTVLFYRDLSKPMTPVVPVYSAAAAGRKIYDVHSTDIRVFYGGKEIPSYNIGGQTAVRLRDIAVVGEARFDPTYKCAEAFCFNAVYHDNEIAYIKAKFYGTLLLLSRADREIYPVIEMVERGVYNDATLQKFKTFYDEMLRQFTAFQNYKEPDGFSSSAMELWWAMVNARYAGETAIIMAETLQKGGNAKAAMHDYNQYRSDDWQQRTLALSILSEEIKTKFFGM